MSRTMLVVAAASIGVCSLTTPCRAQVSRQGTYIYQDQYRPSYGVPAPAYYPAPSAPAMGTEASRAFYPGAEPDKVLINVAVPSDATVSFQGKATTQTGSLRRFISPAIATGYSYTYSVQATWMENGRVVSQSRSFAVQPGEVVNIMFAQEGVTIRSK